jgi:flagellin
MDVNSINNNINTLNQPIASHVDKSQSSNKIDKVDSDFLSLNINEYNKKRDELSINVQALNDGIGISKTATDAITKQSDYIRTIQTQLENLKEDDFNIQDKNDIKQNINENLKNFNQVAYETKYQNESLLSVDYSNQEKSVEISTQNNNYSFEKPNTPEFANSLFEQINQSNLNDPQQLEETIQKVENTSNQLQNLSDQFTDLGNKLETSARETIQEQINLYNNNRLAKDKNFGIESSDFSKNNVSANLGYLAASQANIVQAQSVRLLS